MFGGFEDEVLSVSELTRSIRETLESGFDDLTIEGELSNVRRYASGHIYFTLKDADAQLSGVMWRGFTRYLAFEPEDGLLVRVRGHLSVYEARGIYQVVARSMRPAGEGALRLAFEALKQQLAGEGLFDPAHKKPLPAIPRTIGIVTSGDGAALRDILTVLSRRFPLVQVMVCPVRVQGSGAAEQIAGAVDAFNALDDPDIPMPDLLIVGRGGGSIEDLWAFNEEIVARALHASAIPVISAVGHEIDFTIADLVADVRAATPTEAAEVAVPNALELQARLHGVRDLLTERARTLVVQHRQRVRTLTQIHAFRRPVDRLRQTMQRTDEAAARLQPAALRRVRELARHVEALSHRLAALHPQAPLHRGYAYVERSGEPVVEARGLNSGDEIRLRFIDGDRAATILDDDV